MIALLAGIGMAGAAQAAEVNLYTTREPGLIKPLIEAYAAKSGVKVNTVFVEKGLAERVAAEGARSGADVVMTVDIGNLLELVDRDLAQPVRSPALEAAVPAALRDPEGRWFGLSMRARVLYADKDLADLKSATYESLADPQWKGKVCLRPGQHPYNTALISAFLVRHGPEKTETWLRGLKANLARKAAGGDRGRCPGHRRRPLRGRTRQFLLCRADALRPRRPRAAEMGRGDQGRAADLRGRRYPRERLRRDRRQERPEPRRGGEVLGIPRLRRGPGPLRPHRLRVPGEARRRGRSAARRLRPLSIDATPLTEIARNRKAASLLVDKVGFDN